MHQEVVTTRFPPFLNWVFLLLPPLLYKSIGWWSKILGQKSDAYLQKVSILAPVCCNLLPLVCYSESIFLPISHCIFYFYPESKFMKHFPKNCYAWAVIFIFIAEHRWISKIKRTASILKGVFKSRFDTDNDYVALMLVLKRVCASVFINKQKDPVKMDWTLIYRNIVA